MKNKYLQFFYCGLCLLTIFTNCTHQTDNIKLALKQPVKVWASENNIFMVRPNSIAYNPIKNFVYVLDEKEKQVFVFNDSMKYQFHFGRPGQGPGEMMYPCDIASDKLGNVYVLDNGNHRVQKYDSEGKYLSAIKLTNSQCDDFSRLEINSQGYTIVSYPTGEKLISIYDKAGNIVNQIGDWLDEPWINNSSLPEFYNNVLFCIDEEDNYYIAFLSHPILRKYSKDGKLIFEKDLNIHDGIKKLYKAGLPKMREKAKTPSKTINYTFQDISYSKDSVYLYANTQTEDDKYLSIMLELSPKHGECKSKLVMKKENETGPGKYERFTRFTSHENSFYCVLAYDSEIWKF